ncbi:MAG TPA: folylpolyglutamate synthase/dihydrofolate synthase family protein [Verrucomicrobiae bacterium]|jgi:dihydrofolate synthase/folylpolyglutamate synthase|nr:folylpolyglutamate synthase/dihydrofolate synthase family protein [Verrucomicrobiae bacterium]
MTYSAAIEFLYGLRLFGTKLGLENTLKLAKLQGNPQENLRFIHVAGTNGKGSTCAMLESIYRKAGLRVGLFTSPHLVSFTERMQVNRLCMTEEKVAELTASLAGELGGTDAALWPFHPTFFEFVTVMALSYFVEQRCELVIWETGLGGRLDATNIVRPLASVITNIQLDHQQWLGNSLGEIATEKAGIIKPGIPVVTGARGEAALGVIQRIASERNSPVTLVEETEFERSASAGHLSLLGKHQKANASVALATVQALQNTLPVSQEAIREGFETITWPGRLQHVKIAQTEVLLDGAHNPDGARTLRDALAQEFAAREITLVLGLFKDKAWTEMCEILVPSAKRVFLVPLESDRSANPNAVAAFCAERWPSVQVNIMVSVAAGLDAALRESFAVIAGSLHLIGEVMQLLRIIPDARSERELNEWDAEKNQLPSPMKHHE